MQAKDTTDLSDVGIGPGVPRWLADCRFQALSDVHYQISLEIPEDRDERIRGHLRAHFRLSRAAEPVIFDFARPAEAVLAVTVDGMAIPYTVYNEHIAIPKDVLLEGDNAIEISFIAGDGSLNRNADFLYSLFVPDRARFALPVFDQPNLKARFTLRLDIPAPWQAVSNSVLTQHEIDGARARFAFAETVPISTYLFAFVAGAFQLETAERSGRQLRMYHRETDRAKLEHNCEAIFDLHGAALEWLETYTSLPYPFDKFDCVLIPSFQYKGMEHPGAIYYRDQDLLLDENAATTQQLDRASLIAHETAHMWFGNLVTMAWFDDVWLKEVFANFMAAKIVNPAFRPVPHNLSFLLSHYPEAYRIDRTAGTHPIQQKLDNLNEAGMLYGPIIYHKAPIMMQHLERLMGEAAFQEGLREYLATYQFGNATWHDLIAILDHRTSEELYAWSRVWVEGAHRPIITTHREMPAGKAQTFTLRQSDPAGTGRCWNQQLDVLLGYEDGGERRLPVQLKAESVRVSIRATAPDFILVNGDGLGYGRFELDPQSQEYLLANLPAVTDPLTQATAWLSLWDGMLEGTVRPVSLISVALATLEPEPDELFTHRVLNDLTCVYWRFLTTDQRLAFAEAVEHTLWGLINRTNTTIRKATYFGVYRDVALTTAAVSRLEHVWSGKETVPDLPLSEHERTAVAYALAVRGVDKAEGILDQQYAGIANPDRRARFLFVRPALSATQAIRDGFFWRLQNPKNREREPWVVSGLRFLHHPLRARQSEHYIRPGLDMLEEIQRTGDIFFPQGWVDATLSGHSSRAAAQIVRNFLTERFDLPLRLQEKVLQAADLLFRASALVTEEG